MKNLANVFLVACLLILFAWSRDARADACGNSAVAQCPSSADPIETTPVYYRWPGGEVKDLVSYGNCCGADGCYQGRLVMCPPATRARPGAELAKAKVDNSFCASAPEVEACQLSNRMVCPQVCESDQSSPLPGYHLTFNDRNDCVDKLQALPEASTRMLVPPAEYCRRLFPDYSSAQANTGTETARQGGPKNPSVSQLGSGESFQHIHIGAEFHP
jgi:hypothetical protein